MSKPLHKLELPSLDDLFDDTFERNARRVLDLADGLERKYGESQFAQSQPAAANSLERRSDEPQQTASSSWLSAEIGPAVGLFLLGVGLLAISFAVTLFFLNTMERQNTFQDYIWPVGLAGLLVALIGLVLRVQVRRTELAPQQDSDVGLFSPAANPRYRWDAGHGTPSTQAPERRKSARRV